MKAQALAGLGAACALTILLAGCGSSAEHDVATPRLDHVAVVVMENHEYGQVVGSRGAPWLTAQAQDQGQAIDYHGVTHPSLPNYLALLGGSTFKVTTDCADCHVDATNLVDQLEQAGLSWRAYMDSMPRPCFMATSGRDETGLYAKRHNPFFYFDDIRTNPDRCKRVVPFSSLATDMAAPGRLADFIWITPNLCHDMHDCPIGVGDRWLREEIPALTRALGPNSAVFITWDEGVTDDGVSAGKPGGGRIPLVALGSAVRPHSEERSTLDHYGLLRTIEETLGLPLMRQAAHAEDLSSLLAPA